MAATPSRYSLRHGAGDPVTPVSSLHVRMRGRTASGNTYHGPYHMLFRIDGDRIAEGWEFLDTAYCIERIGPAFPGGERP